MSAISNVACAAVLLLGASATPLIAQDRTAEERELAELRAQVDQLRNRIDELESRLASDAPDSEESPVAEAPEAAPETTVVWKGAPQVENSSGWSFKPRGRLMFDAGFTVVPESTGRDDGFGNEARRARLGVEGTVPGGFGYRFEADFAGDEIDVVDAFLTYENGPAEVTIGQHNNFQSLEELTSSLHTSFLERAAFTDAFGFERRIGVSLGYSSGILLAQVGAFTDNFSDTGTDNRGVDARIVLMPEFGEAQAHFGASLHYNDLGTPGTAIRYRQRPLVHFTSERFVDTRDIGAEAELGYGLEAALIAGRFHAAAEGFWQHLDRSAALPDPTFFGGYAELGYFLTRDTRGYGSGKFDRVKPTSPLGRGRIGSVQFNLRYDYLDLDDAGVLGGIQDGYYASLIWKPIDYVLFALNYGRLQYDGAIFPAANGDTSYGVDAFGVRAQVDF